MSIDSILIVDDEPQIIRFLAPSLKAAGYRVMTAATGAEALKLVATSSPSLVLLDLGLPDIDGKQVIAALREWSQVPVIVVSARGRESEKIAALDLGADDYIDKPFAMGELLARLRAALRHAARSRHETTAITIGDLEVDTLAHSAKRAGRNLKLTPKEFDLLALLIRHAGRAVTHRQLLTSVWGPGHSEDLQYLRVFIRQLRQKLEQAPERPALIITEPGVGYRLVAEID